MATFDDVLQQIGDFGHFQKQLFVLLCLASVCFGSVYVCGVFLAVIPEHWCSNPKARILRDKCGWTQEEERNYSVPVVEGTASFQQCQTYSLDWNSTEFNCYNVSLLLSNYSRHTIPVTECVGEWIYSGSVSSVVSQFNLVCDDDWKVDLFQSSLNIGLFIGTIIMGYLADRFGRKICFLFAAFATAVSGVLMAFAQSYSLLLFFRILQGLFSTGAWSIAYVLATELVGSCHRRAVGVFLQMSFSVGVIVIPGVAYLIQDWRWLQLAISLPYFLFLLYYWCLPESPRWLFARNKNTKAMAITNQIAKRNGIKLPYAARLKKLRLEENSNNPSYFDLVKTPQMRKHTFILMFVWFTCAVVYQGLVLRLGVLGGNLYLEFFVTALVEFPAGIIIFLVIDRLGRRLPFSISNLMAGVACLACAFIPEDMYWLQTIASSFGRLGITISFQVVNLVNAELYPTFMRNLGLAVCSSLCDVGGIIAPFILYRLAAIWSPLPAAFFGIIGLIAGGSVLFLPETKSMVLPETIEEVEQMHRKKTAYLPGTSYPLDDKSQKEEAITAHA
ncbi:solute carrier family 22 member 2-like [Protopterus annectens]|uniref:solute carrier family 22 member 2-like n=1 Tax=Protopterus annectens TaxID=7888 RepID=UPI001CFA420C|nr:solute carrier family 22 member 2-like [Protopterus annectens]